MAQKCEFIDFGGGHLEQGLPTEGRSRKKPKWSYDVLEFLWGGGYMVGLCSSRSFAAIFKMASDNKSILIFSYLILFGEQDKIILIMFGDESPKLL